MSQGENGQGSRRDPTKESKAHSSQEGGRQSEGYVVPESEMGRFSRDFG